MAGSTFAVGEISYNGYTFPGAVTAKVRAVPIYDTADRARKYVQYTLTVETIVTGGEAPAANPGGNTDDNLDDIRKRLTTPNKTLTFSEQGFGSFTIDGSTVIDSRFGPKPRLLAWEPVGSNRACRIAWTCEATIPECSDSTPLYTGAFAEITYETNWSINEAGMTVRTIRATLEIPVDTNGNAILDNADRYREFVNPPVPVGFWRDRNYSESRDKRTLEITIVDTEVPSENPFFPSAVRCDVRHRINSDLENRGLVWWTSTIDGTIEYAPGASRAQLYQAFLAVVEDRRLRGVGIKLNLNDIKQYTGNEGYPIPISVSIEESLFSRELSFSISWQVFADLSQIFKATGLFMPVPNGDWSVWKGSLSQANGIRGIAGMASQAADDVIVDLCAVNYPNINSDINKNISPYSQPIFTPSCTHVTAKNSWLKYDARFSIMHEFNTAQHLTLAEKPIAHITQSGGNYPDPTKKGLAMDQLTDSMSSSSQEYHTTQIRGPVKSTLIFKGNAERVCEDIPVPRVASIGGKTPAIKKSWYEPYIKSSSTYLTTYGLVWYHEYYLDSPPEGDFYSTLEAEGIPSAYTGTNNK